MHLIFVFIRKDIFNFLLLLLAGSLGSLISLQYNQQEWPVWEDELGGPVLQWLLFFLSSQCQRRAEVGPGTSDIGWGASRLSIPVPAL